MGIVPEALGLDHNLQEVLSVSVSYQVASQSYVPQTLLEIWWPERFLHWHAERLRADSHSSVVMIRALPVQVKGPWFNSQKLPMFIMCISEAKCSKATHAALHFASEKNLPSGWLSRSLYLYLPVSSPPASLWVGVQQDEEEMLKRTQAIGNRSLTGL